MPDLFGNARASKKPVSGTRALKQPDEGLFLAGQHDVGHTEAVARISALLGMPLEQRRCPGFLGDHGRPHTQFVAGDRDGKFAFAIGESLVIGTAEQVDRAKLIGGEPAQDIELGSSFDDDRSVLQEFEKPLGAEAFESPGYGKALFDQLFVGSGTALFLEVPEAKADEIVLLAVFPRADLCHDIDIERPLLGLVEETARRVDARSVFYGLLAGP